MNDSVDEYASSGRQSSSRARGGMRKGQKNSKGNGATPDNLGDKRDDYVTSISIR
jgi:hypothetical protein